LTRRVFQREARRQAARRMIGANEHRFADAFRKTPLRAVGKPPYAKKPGQCLAVKIEECAYAALGLKIYKNHL
jgi:hypothetical protein